MKSSYLKRGELKRGECRICGWTAQNLSEDDVCPTCRYRYEGEARSMRRSYESTRNMRKKLNED